MEDLIYLAVLFAFFAFAGLFVVFCDRIIGSDEEALTDRGAPVEPEPEEARLAA
jgi:hypothetical protein